MWTFASQISRQSTTDHSLEKAQNAISCVTRWSRHLLLFALLIVYAFAGALVFKFVEGPNQEREWSMSEARVIHIRELFIKETLLSLEAWSGKLGTPIFEGNCTGNVSYCAQEWLRRKLIQYETALNMDPRDVKYAWTFWNALFYAGTVFTTIGYGELYCRTFTGQLCTVVYALFGIPLLLVVLGDLSKILYKYCLKLWNCAVARVHSWRAGAYSVQRVHSQASVDTVTLHPEANIPFVAALILLFLYVLVCSAIFLIWETRWTYWTAFYFFFISLSTIGFGDVYPDSPKNAIFGFFFIMVGLALVNLCITVIQMRMGGTFYRAVDQVQRQLQKSSARRHSRRWTLSSAQRQREQAQPQPQQQVTATAPVLLRRNSCPAPALRPNSLQLPQTVAAAPVAIPPRARDMSNDTCCDPLPRPHWEKKRWTFPVPLEASADDSAASSSDACDVTVSARKLASSRSDSSSDGVASMKSSVSFSPLLETVIDSADDH